MNTTIEKFHLDTDFAESINRLSEEETFQLEENLLQEGCRDALIAWQEENLLLDGHNRFELCQKHGLPYETHYISLPDRQAALEWICKNQLGRRNLTPFQKTELVLKFKPMLVEEAKKRQRSAGKEYGKNHPKEEVPDNCPEPKAGEVREELAAKAGVSGKTINRAEYLSKHADDKTKQKLRSGETTINAEYKKLRKEEARRDRQERKQTVVAIPDDQQVQLFVSNITDAATHVKPNSVDFIITDPPYPKEYLSTFSSLANFAVHALKPSGSLICMSGQSYLPEVYQLLTAYEELHYHWTLAYLTPGGQASQLWDRKVNTFWKPLLWFVKGNYQGDWIGDVVRSDVNNNDKEHHPWGQSVSGMLDLLDRFVFPGQIVCDPFLGGGTTALAARQCNCRFIGLDIDEKGLDTTQRRLAKRVQENVA